jgi:hypothetical protein
MNIEDELKKFDEYNPESWFCPLIKKLCDRQCYCYQPKGVRFLIKKIGPVNTQTWSPRFLKSVDTLNWRVKKTDGFQILEVRLCEPYCDYFDSLITTSKELQCRNE